MAEGARLESVYTLTGIQGSNPCLSASLLYDENKPRPQSEARKRRERDFFEFAERFLVSDDPKK